MTREKLTEIYRLVIDLGWDYERLTVSGKETYKKLCNELGMET